jgi:hypothetical protein
MTRTTSANHQHQHHQLSGLDRRSCSWLDAVGPSYAVGPSSRVLRLATSLASRGYCG